MEIRKIPISQINPASYNPRVDLKPDDSEYQKLKQSITTFGYVNLIVWNKQTGNLVGGHQGFKILIEQGVKEIEVSVVDLCLTKEKALNLALNKIQGRWDEDKLAALIAELNHLPDFDIGLTGFDVPEISEIMDRLTQPQEDDFDFNAAVEGIDKAVTRQGDLIKLGPHKILCGDSSNADDFKLLMGDKTADMLDVDVPYNVNYYGGDRPNNKSRPSNHKMWQRIYSDNLSQSDYEAWMRKVFENIKRHLKPGAAIYIWQGHRQIPPMYQILLELGFHVSSIICWLKESIAFSYGDYSFRNEHALYGWLEGKPHYFAGKRGESNVWEVHRDPTKDYQHPTQKPVELASRAIRNSSRRNDIVLDCCLGSGSCLISAVTLGRRCFGIEIDPKYCDAIVQRYIAFVGQDNVSDDIRRKYIKEAYNG